MSDRFTRLLAGPAMLAIGWCGTAPAQQPQGPSDLAIISSRSIFLRDRKPAPLPEKQAIPLPPPSIEEQFALRGIVFEQSGFCAYLEKDGQTRAFKVGDRIADGIVTEIAMDGIRYRKEGQSESLWIRPGRNLAGSLANLRESRR